MSIDVLKQYENDGYVFHGSPISGIQVLETRQSKDVEIKEGFNIDNAVFASRYLSGAIIFACMSFDNIPESLSGIWSVNRVGGKIVAKIPYAWKEFVERNSGYVYVLKPDTFNGDSEGWQVKSLESVPVEYAQEVQFQNFEEYGGVVEWASDHES